MDDEGGNVVDWLNVYVFAGWGKVDGRRFLRLSALRGREIQLPSLMFWKDGKGMEEGWQEGD